MKDEVLVKVDGVSKKFCRTLKRSLWYGVQDVAGELVGRNVRSNELRLGEFWATKDVSLELHRGECLGLIGQNGAGKTTLLRMLNGLIKPDRGRIELTGRVGALIALGAGFNPILTGRENIYVNGAVLGLKKREIDRKFEEIVDFSGIEEFIDSPVQSYSSGMNVRLGFAVATALEPDILIIDEVLAVGDRAFQQKCYTRLGRMKSKCCIILVSHQMHHITRMADRCVVMINGKAQKTSSIDESIDIYNRSCAGDMNYIHASDERIREFSVRVDSHSIRHGQDLTVSCLIDCKEDVMEPFFQVFIRDVGEQIVSEWTSHNRDFPVKKLRAGPQEISIDLEKVSLAEGMYTITFNVLENNRLHFIASSVNEISFHTDGRPKSVSSYQL